MKYRNNKKIVLLTIITLIFQLIISSKVFASAYINVPDTVEAGQPINVSVSGSGAQWVLSILANGNSIGNDSKTQGLTEENINFSGSYATSNNDAGKEIEISLDGSVTNEDGSTVRDFDKKTVKIIESSSGGEDPEQHTDKNKVPSESGESSSDTPKEDKSSNNYLESLSVSEGKLTPSFDRATTEYTVEFPDDFDWKKLNSINISAKKDHEKASISGTGETSLNDGENIIEIKVTAENDSVRTYKIKIVKPETIKQSDLRLKSLEISKIDKDNKFTKVKLNKDFDPAVFEYTLDVGKDITSLDVDAKVEKEGIIVSVEGEKNLKSGKNEVKIILKAKDDPDVKTTYIIKVNKEEEKAAGTNEEKKDNGSGLKGIIIGIIVFIVILAGTLVTLLIINHKRKKADSIEYSKKAKKPSRNFVDFDIYDDEQADKEAIDEEKITDDDNVEDVRLSDEDLTEEIEDTDDIDSDNDNEFEDVKLDESDTTEEIVEDDENIEKTDNSKEIENTKVLDDEYEEKIKKATKEPKYDDWEESSILGKKKKGKGKRFL